MGLSGVWLNKKIMILFVLYSALILACGKRSLQFSTVETNCQSFTMDGMVFHLVQLHMEMVYIRIMAGLTERLICNNLL